MVHSFPTRRSSDLLPRAAAEVEHPGPRFETQRRAESVELLGCDRVVDAVSAFGDIEDSGDVHYRKLLLYCRRIGSGLVFEHSLSMALAECKRDMFEFSGLSPKRALYAEPTDSWSLPDQKHPIEA